MFFDIEKIIFYPNSLIASLQVFNCPTSTYGSCASDSCLFFALRYPKASEPVSKVREGRSTLGVD